MGHGARSMGQVTREKGQVASDKWQVVRGKRQGEKLITGKGNREGEKGSREKGKEKGESRTDTVSFFKLSSAEGSFDQQFRQVAGSHHSSISHSLPQPKSYNFIKNTN